MVVNLNVQKEEGEHRKTRADLWLRPNSGALSTDFERDGVRRRGKKGDASITRSVRQ